MAAAIVKSKRNQRLASVAQAIAEHYKQLVDKAAMLQNDEYYPDDTESELRNGADGTSGY